MNTKSLVEYMNACRLTNATKPERSTEFKADPEANSSKLFDDPGARISHSPRSREECGELDGSSLASSEGSTSSSLKRCGAEATIGRGEGTSGPSASESEVISPVSDLAGRATHELWDDLFGRDRNAEDALGGDHPC